MTNIIHCPRCKRPISLLGELETFQARCTNCCYKYLIANGTVVSRHVWAQGKQSPSSFEHEYCYEIRVQEKNTGKINAFEFSLPGDKDRLLVFPSDLVSLIYTMREEKTSELIQIFNHTSAKITHISYPGKRAWQIARSMGLLVFPAALLGMTTAGISLPLAGIISAMTSSMIGYSTKLICSDKMKPNQKSKQAQFGIEQSLLLQFEALSKRLSKLEAEQEEMIRLKARLSSLAQNMREEKADLYKARLKQLERAINLTDRLELSSQVLLKKYRQCLNTLNTEIQSYQNVDLFPEGFAESLIFQIAEAQTLDKHFDKLKLQIEADEEIRVMLSQIYN